MLLWGRDVKLIGDSVHQDGVIVIEIESIRSESGRDVAVVDTVEV